MEGKLAIEAKDIATFLPSLRLQGIQCGLVVMVFSE